VTRFSTSIGCVANLSTSTLSEAGIKSQEETGSDRKKSAISDRNRENFRSKSH
jgi:hypothetical protein